MKKRLFIGSSIEELPLANIAKGVLDEWFDVTIWDDTIWEKSTVRLNQNILSGLLKASLQFDYGILLGTDDDRVVVRGEEKLQPRDNILFELGLFMGRLGIEKCAFVIEKSIKVLTDFNGIKLARFDRQQPESFIKAILQVKELFEHSKETEVNFFPSATLAAVYFENFIVPICETILKNKGFTSHGVHYAICHLKIIVPNNIDKDVNRQFEILKKSISTATEVFEYDGRPRNISVDIKSKNGSLEFVDFPTIVAGINYAIMHLLPQEFEKKEEEYAQILERELNRFVATLEKMIEDDGYKDIVNIVWQKDLQ
jgi:Predicted nucleotide-binding protein containing TIR-like domain